MPRNKHIQLSTPNNIGQDVADNEVLMTGLMPEMHLYIYKQAPHKGKLKPSVLYCFSGLVTS